MANSNKARVPPDFSSNLAQLYRSVYTSEPIQLLPLSWNSKDRLLNVKLSQFALTITCTADTSASRHSTYYPISELPTVKADHPIPVSAGIYYFETTIASFKPNCTVMIGVASRRASKFSGWDSSSFGYHSDGSLYHHTTPTPFGPKFCEQDIIGCGVDLITKSLFYTRNGEFLGKAFEGKLPVSAIPDLYPVIALDGQGCRVTTNFGDQPFFYPFKRHIAEEREAHENRLIGALSKDFIDVKMRDLVAGYLVHHGYIDSARVFSRWTSFGESGSSAKKTRNEEAVEGAKDNADGNEETEEEASLPGFASMQHRRSLRTFCHRCQYGRVASTLTALYPNIVERYPELILQLRCRQLVEMMYRHSEQRSSHPLSSSDSKLQQTMGGSRKRPCTTNTSACCRTSESVPTLATCDDDRSVSKYLHTDSPPDVDDQAHFPNPGSSAATSCDAMDIDSSLAFEANGNHPPHSQFCSEDQQLYGVSTDAPSFSATATNEAEQLMPCELYDDDDDGFGITGDLSQQHEALEPIPMEMESAGSDRASTPAFTTAPPKGMVSQSSSSLEGNAEEKNRLLRQIQFSRSLVDLAKQVKDKCGSLSPETEHLLQQSVSLMAYPSPSSPECPLRCLLDPSWRDNIASLINSAILTEAHHLPPQPAIEQALYALQKCFANREFQEAQILGHFLLYHLSPSKYTTEIRLQHTASSPPPSQIPAAFHSSESSNGRQEMALQTNNNNSAGSSERIPNGRASPPKRHLFTPPSSNGSRRHWRRRHTPAGNSGSRPVMRYAPVETLPSSDEDEVEDISMEEGVQLHHHEELEDDHEEIESLDEEAEVELMTATMEEDGFEEDVEQNAEENDDDDDDDEDEEVDEDEEEDDDDDEEEEEEEEVVENEAEEELSPQRETFSSFFTEGRILRRTGARDDGSGGRSRGSTGATNSGRRGESFGAYTSEVSRLPGTRPRRYSRLVSGGGSVGRSAPSSRSSRRSDNASAGNANNNSNNNQ
uniref:Ran binding protein 9 n=1 Tax=Echinococcus granulosus TaxID=6210 RepID=A0A068WM74_ECHGR|nr:ran binding protein 9 [Echinococcus granulosus]